MQHPRTRTMVLWPKYANINCLNTQTVSVCSIQLSQQNTSLHLGQLPQMKDHTLSLCNQVKVPGKRLAVVQNCFLLQEALWQAVNVLRPIETNQPSTTSKLFGRRGWITQNESRSASASANFFKGWLGRVTGASSRPFFVSTCSRACHRQRGN